MIATRDSLSGMNSPRNRAPLDRVGQRAAGRRRITGATAWTAAGGAALAVAFGTVFAQGAAADTAAKTAPAAPPVVDDWVAPAAVQVAPAAPKTTPKKSEPAAPKKVAPAPVTEAPAPPASPPAATDDSDDTAPDASTGGS